MKTLSSEAWYAIAVRIFASWGAPEDIAACVARSLVEADLVGVASHGLARIPVYYAYWQAGWFKPGSRAEVIREGPATATLDGHWGFGQPAMHAALDLGIAKCRGQGIAAVGLQRSGHIGRLGEYAEKAAAAGVVALVMASG